MYRMRALMPMSKRKSKKLGVALFNCGLRKKLVVILSMAVNGCYSVPRNVI